MSGFFTLTCSAKSPEFTLDVACEEVLKAPGVLDFSGCDAKILQYYSKIFLLEST